MRPNEFTRLMFAASHWNLLYEITKLSSKGIPLTMNLLRKRTYIGGGNMYKRIKILEKEGLIKAQRVIINDERDKQPKILITDVEPTEYGVEIAKGIQMLLDTARRHDGNKPAE